jgi:hypothetical protein
MVGITHVYHADSPPIERDEPQAPARIVEQAREYTPEQQLINQRIAGARRWRR